jgi:DeoR/GlpR family transcriptional regulator of sugar metabolism
MFGSKDEKTTRLQKMTELIEQKGRLSVDAIAKQLGINRATIYKYLPYLKDVDQDEQGRIGLVWWKESQ